MTTHESWRQALSLFSLSGPLWRKIWWHKTNHYSTCTRWGQLLMVSSQQDKMHGQLFLQTVRDRDGTGETLPSVQCMPVPGDESQHSSDASLLYGWFLSGRF